MGWWQKINPAERAAVETYIGPAGMSPVWSLMRASASSVAELALVPAQDLLELGSEARMNTPAVASGNWSWRAPEGSWAAHLARGLADLVDVTDRDNDPIVPSSVSMAPLGAAPSVPVTAPVES
jgi:4-alpha-glucanotransferase